MNKEIILGEEVYLSDPCYDTKTWCQALLTIADLYIKDGKVYGIEIIM